MRETAKLEYRSLVWSFRVFLLGSAVHNAPVAEILLVLFLKKPLHVLVSSLVSGVYPHKDEHQCVGQDNWRISQQDFPVAEMLLNNLGGEDEADGLVDSVVRSGDDQAHHDEW